MIAAIAYNSYRRKRTSMMRSPSSVGHSVAKEQSYLVFKATFRYAVTSIIYLIGFIPILACQNYLAFYGPFSQEKAVVYGVFYGLYQPMVALLNLSAYGFFSESFRTEMKVLFIRVAGACRRRKTFLGDELFLTEAGINDEE